MNGSLEGTLAFEGTRLDTKTSLQIDRVKVGALRIASIDIDAAVVGPLPTPTIDAKVLATEMDHGDLPHLREANLRIQGALSKLHLSGGYVRPNSSRGSLDIDVGIDPEAPRITIDGRAQVSGAAGQRPDVPGDAAIGADH